MTRKTTAIDKKIGELIRAWRKESRKTMQDLESIIKVSYQQIYKYELGIDRLSLSRFLQLCEVYDKDPASGLSFIIREA